MFNVWPFAPRYEARCRNVGSRSWQLNSEEYQNIAQGGGLHTKVPAHRDSRQTINSVFFALEFGVIWLFSDLPSKIQILDFETFLNMGPTPKYGNTVKFTSQKIPKKSRSPN